MTLPALQAYVRQIVAHRGFTADLNEVFVLMVEELGELATEFKHRAYAETGAFDEDNLALELADLLLYLLDLANGFGCDLMALWPEHEDYNDARWKDRPGAKGPQAKVAPGASLNALVAHAEAKRRERGFEDSPERLMVLLTEEVGELAHELRKHWKGKTTPQRAGSEVIDALHYLFRLTATFSVDLEAAVRRKEAQNASRTWSY